jgi:diguanylate cyclase (GGDEF)-like protein
VTQRRQDAILISSLIAFGLTLVAVAYLSALLFTGRVVEAEARSTAESFVPRIAETRATPDRADDFGLRRAAREANVLRWALFDRGGERLAGEEIGAEGDLRGPLAAGGPSAADVARAAAGETLVHPTMEGARRRVEVLTAAPGGERVVQLVLDRTTIAGVLDASLGVISAAAAFFVWLAFFIPVVVAWRRIKERMAAEKRIHHLAHHDVLTDLPNRALFHDRLDRALARSKRGNTRLAVLALDLDRFKFVNDTLGHAAGDGLLKSVARRLEEAVRETDTVARLGGDEFAVIAEDVKGAEECSILARRIVESLAKPHLIDGNQIISAGSVGIAMTPEDGLEPDLLMKNADLALYRAKNEGRGTFRFFEARMDADLQARRELEHDLRVAVREDAFSVHYQPQQDLATGDIQGYEALVRWEHPVRGDVPPAVFLPVAEESGLIVWIGEWVLKRACRDATRWPPHLKVAVNLSSAQFKKNDVGQLVETILEDTGLDPRRLEIEIVETLLLHNTDSVIKQLEHLRSLGVSVAMDDFGTGYSSLSYLARFPFNKVKIDKSFVQRLDRDQNVAAIVNSIIGLGSTLHVTVTAEGVETEAQADALRAAGCAQVQGFLFGRPMPADAVTGQVPSERVADATAEPMPHAQAA